MSNSQQPREYISEEVREAFLRYIWALVEFWEHEERVPSVRGKLEGFAHGLLYLFDGASLDIPAFILAPNPHEDDQTFYQEQGKNWFPQNDASQIQANIAGRLHELFEVYKPFEEQN